MKLDRDALTRLTYLQLGCYGYFIYGFGPTLSLLRDEQGVSRSVAGLHGTALAVGSLLAALIVAPLLRRHGRSTIVWSGMAGLCAGVLTYVSSTALPATLLGVTVAAFGGSFVVVSSAPVLSDRHGVSGPSAISEANAVAAGAGTVAPLVVGACVGLGLGWRPALLLLLPVVLVLAFAGRHVRAPSPAPVPHHIENGRLPRRFWISWAVVTAGIAVEFCLLLWTADVLREQMGLAPGQAAAGLTALVAGMCVGRVAGGRLALRFPLDQLLYAAILTTMAGFTVFWLAGTVVLGLPALLVCGLGIALFYPLGIARAIEASEGRPDQASARVGLGAALASGAAPFLLGAIADVVGIRLALLVVPALLVGAAIGIRVGRPGAPVGGGPYDAWDGERSHGDQSRHEGRCGQERQSGRTR